ncbi:MAG TPA: ABC transporter permease subunit [Steroidobacteraceae bacterium]|jgi:oligopeptide transport system permease protein|nr:ABC transporter permease subunit [Steroidobacteraceae bacterium]
MAALPQAISPPDTRAADPVSGFWGRVRRALRADRRLALAVVVLLLIVLASLLWPLLSSYDYYTPDLTQISRPPSWQHLLGTDPLGRDLLVRIMWGCRVSLAVGVFASLISVAIGVAWGAIAGYAGGLLDGLMMRAVDVLYTIPFVPFVIILAVMFGRQLWLIFVAIGAVSWLDIARIVRGQTLSLRQREFIDAARVAGVHGLRMVFRHIVPNLLGIVAVYATLIIPAVILFEAFLSFLGMGVRPPLSSLGALVADGASDMQAHPHLLIAPAIFLAVIVYCFNFIGDGLRDLLDARGRSGTL